MKELLTTSADVLSINVGIPIPFQHRNRQVVSGIYKEPIFLFLFKQPATQDIIFGFWKKELLP